MLVDSGNKATLSRLRRRRGASAVEMAIILPIFATLVLATVDFGRFAYNYIAVTNAARAGAAWVMMNPPDNMSSPSSGWQTGNSNTVTNEISSQPGYQSGSLTVSTVTPTSETGGTWRFTVTASYPFQTLVNWNFNFLGTTLGIPSSMTLQKSVTMRGIRP
jgi:Flp pilus assembly protein TadG